MQLPALVSWALEVLLAFFVLLFRWLLILSPVSLDFFLCFFYGRVCRWTKYGKSCGRFCSSRDCFILPRKETYTLMLIYLLSVDDFAKRSRWVFSSFHFVVFLLRYVMPNLAYIHFEGIFLLLTLLAVINRYCFLLLSHLFVRTPAARVPWKEMQRLKYQPTPWRCRSQKNSYITHLERILTRLLY